MLRFSMMGRSFRNYVKLLATLLFKLKIISVVFEVFCSRGQMTIRKLLPYRCHSYVHTRARAKIATWQTFLILLAGVRLQLCYLQTEHLIAFERRRRKLETSCCFMCRKSNVYPRTDHEGQKYSCILSLTSVLNGASGQRQTPASIPPPHRERDSVPMV
jgi:hypothetical protein